MFGLGTPEIIVILVLALVILGPTKLPQVAKTIGKGLASLRRTADEVKREIDVEALKNEISEEVGLDELRGSLHAQGLRNKVKEALVGVGPDEPGSSPASGDVSGSGSESQKSLPEKSQVSDQNPSSLVDASKSLGQGVERESPPKKDRRGP